MMRKSLITLLKSTAIAFLLNSFFLIPIVQAQLTYQIIACDELKENVEILRKSMRELIPEAKEIYIDYRSRKAERLIKELDLKFIPYVIFDKKVSQESIFFHMVKNNLIAKKKGFYVIPDEQLRLSDIFLLDRANMPNRLDIFVTSYYLYAKEAEARLINYIRENKLNINLRIRFITTFRDYGIDSLGGPEEIREDIRQLIIQKYFSDKFFDYLLVRKNSSYEDSLVRLGLDKEEIERLEKKGLELLKIDAQLAKELSISHSPTFLWQNQSLIPDLDILMRHRPFNQPEKSPKLISYSPEGKLLIRAFYSLGCNSCQPIKDEFLPAILEKYEDKIQIEYYDIGEKENYQLMVNLGKKFGVLKGGVPKVFVLDACLEGGKEIEEKLEKIIKTHLSPRR